MLCSSLTAAVQSLARERMNSANITVLDDEKVVRKGGVYLKCIRSTCRSLRRNRRIDDLLVS
jgi:hypothetical protein